MTAAAPSIWRNRDVVLLVSGATVNNIGDWLLELALPLYVFTETGSGVMTAAVYLLRLGVGFLFGPIGGRLADTWPLKRSLVATNLLQLIALAPLLLVSDEQLWPIFLVVVLQGLIGAVNDPASFALLPRLVSGEQLVAANSVFSAATSISRLVGAAAGGIAVEIGGMTTVALIDGATFAVGALTALLLSHRANTPPGPSTDEQPDTSVRAAWNEVRSRSHLVALLWIQVISRLVFGGFPVLFIVFVTEYLDGSGTDVGVIRASSALGGLLGAAAVGAIASKVEAPALMTGGFLLFGLISAAFVNAPELTTAIWAYLIVYGATGFPNVASGVGSQSTAQQLCPGHVLGRFGGLMSTAGNLGMGLGAIVFGVLLEVTTARVLLNIESAMFVVCAAIGYFFVVRRTSGLDPTMIDDRLDARSAT